MPGARRDRTLGTVVIVGMAADTLIASFLIPVSFYVVERLSRRREAEQRGAAAASGDEVGTDMTSKPTEHPGIEASR